MQRESRAKRIGKTWRQCSLLRLIKACFDISAIRIVWAAGRSEIVQWTKWHLFDREQQWFRPDERRAGHSPILYRLFEHGLWNLCASERLLLSSLFLFCCFAVLPFSVVVVSFSYFQLWMNNCFLLLCLLTERLQVTDVHLIFKPGGQLGGSISFAGDLQHKTSVILHNEEMTSYAHPGRAKYRFTRWSKTFTPLKNNPYRLDDVFYDKDHLLTPGKYMLIVVSHSNGLVNYTSFDFNGKWRTVQSNWFFTAYRNSCKNRLVVTDTQFGSLSPSSKAIVSRLIPLLNITWQGSVEDFSKDRPGMRYGASTVWISFHLFSVLEGHPSITVVFLGFATDEGWVLYYSFIAFHCHLSSRSTG